MRHLALTTTLAALALPATAAASQGVVLSVNAKHHRVEVVDSHNVVHAFGYSGRLPKLHAGSKIGFTGSRGHIGHVRVVSSSSHAVAFLARVISSSSKGVVFGLADGNKLHFSSKQVTHRRRQRKNLARIASNFGGGISINIEGLEPGVTVLVTETITPDGGISITITLPKPVGAGGGRPAGGERRHRRGRQRRLRPDHR